MQKEPKSLRAVSFATIVLALLLSVILGANYYFTRKIKGKNLLRITTSFALGKYRPDLYLKHIHADLAGGTNHITVKSIFNPSVTGDQNQHHMEHGNYPNHAAILKLPLQDNPLAVASNRCICTKSFIRFSPPSGEKGRDRGWQLFMIMLSTSIAERCSVKVSSAITPHL